MALSVKNVIMTGKGASTERLAAEAANAALLNTQSRGFTAAGCARGTTAQKVKTANTFTYTVAGVFYSLGASDDFWTLSGTVVAAASWQKYLLLVDTGGTASIQEATQSKVSAAGVVWTNVSGLSTYAPFLTALGATKCVVGTLTIATDATHTFTPGTTALNGTGITATFVDGLDQSILPLLANAQGTIIGNGG